MLLDDEAIAQQFALLFRTAEALKQATVVAQRAAPATSPYPHLDGLSSSTTQSTVLPRLGQDPLSSASGGHTSAKRSANGLPTTAAPKTSGHSPSTPDELDVGCIGSPIQLPRVMGDSDAEGLRRIGAFLEDLTKMLQRSVDAKLVDFYAHLARKVDNGPLARTRTAAAVTAATAAPLAPRGTLLVKAHPAASTIAAAREEAAQSGKLTAAALMPSLHTTATAAPPGVKALLPSVSFGAAEGPSSSSTAAAAAARPRAAFILDPQDELPSPTASINMSSTVDGESVLDQSDFDAGAATASVDGMSRRVSPHVHKGLGSHTSSSYSLTHNGPLGRRMEEERAAVAELQSFFCLLLEAALRQTDATAAAVYLDDATMHSAAASGDAPFARTASFIGGVRSGASRPTSATAAASGGAGGSGRAQFLHCVAHVHGHFPRTISYALTNVLTTVAQTGIAVNLNYSESSAVLRPGELDVASPNTRERRKKKAGKAGADTASRSAHSPTASTPSLYLNMYNGVVVPIKGVGCLVLANKAKRSAVAGAMPPRFGVFDEHVAWSSALLSEAVLRQYDRELLMRAPTWAPPCTAALRPFMQAKESSNAGEKAVRTLQNASPERRRLDTRLGTKRRLPESKAVTILPDASTMFDGTPADEMASLVFNTHNDIYAKRLTIVRTEDTQIGKALPPELRTTATGQPPAAAAATTTLSSPRGGHRTAGTAAGTSGELTDEELFLAAAQYITNLESLWRKTISDSNSMHTMIDNYNKEIQQQGEKIVHLESRVRELNAHVVQLERRNNPSRLYGMSTT